MSDVAVHVEGIGKSYRITHSQRASYKTLQEDLLALLKRPFSRDANSKSSRRETFWALKDVSFDVKQGEVLGIIGRNGAGKSTLLKILSRITKPTVGSADVYGRVGSLLEVGTGFHPELTGRENIFLNGAILGMTRREIQRRFDEIVDFAEIEQFLDTPVKRYSSGMYMRLAFAVAAHLDPEILVVDEVLAVGDAEFQKKCLGKMDDVAKSGRTVLFVSHNMAAVASLCTRAIMLNSGNMVNDSETDVVIKQYMQTSMESTIMNLKDRKDRTGDGEVRATSLKVESLSSDNIIHVTSRLKITIRYEAEDIVRYPKFLLGVYDYTGRGIFLLDSDAVGGLSTELPASGIVTCITEPINLTPGPCYINLALYKGAAMNDYVQSAARFTVETEDVFGTGKIAPRDWVLCVLKNQWTLAKVESVPDV